MLSPQENDTLTRVGPGTPMGTLMRQHWTPVCLSEEVAEPDGTPVLIEALGTRMGGELHALQLTTAIPN